MRGRTLETHARRVGRALIWAAAVGLWPAHAVALDTPGFDAVGREAIPRHVVKTLAQDRQGFLWVATGDGLVRFDGYRFQPIERRHADPARRNLGWVKAILAARDGRVWISSEADGLVGYDPATDRIEPHPDPAASGPPAPVLALAEGADGTIWAGTLGGGLEQRRPARGDAPATLTRHRHRSGDPGSLPDDRIESLALDGDGGLWVGSWQGLSRLRPGSAGFDPVPATDPAGDGATLDGRRVLALHAAGRRLWIGTQQGDLVVLDRDSGQASWLAAPSDGRGAVTALTQSEDGRVWVGTGRGIEVWDASATARLHRLQHDPARPGSLAANEVTSLLRDRAGAIWVGGLGIGLQRHNPANVGLFVRRAAPDARFDGNAHGLLALADGRVWAATSSVPLVALDARLQPQGPIDLATGDGAPGITRVQAMTQAPDGRVWLAAQEWLLQLDPQGRVLRRQRHRIGEIGRLLATADGGLWIAALDGLHRRAPGADGAISRLRLAAGDAPLRGQMQALAMAPDGALWVGGVTGLYRLPPGRLDGLEPVESADDGGLGNPVVGGLLFGRDGTLWVDTAITGLHRMIDFEGGRARFDRVSVRHGVHNRPFGQNLLEDRRGRVWTQQYVYDPGGDQLIELTLADGKDFGMGWFFSYDRTPDGRFLFGGTHGVLVVEPERFDASSYMPPLAVTSVRVDGRRASLTGLPPRLALGPEHHGLAIEFAALDFSDPQRIRYAYRLDGVDADWVQTGADFRVASYGNLPPGDYTLRIRATNRNGAWNPEPLDLPLTVAPAWWQRWDTQALGAVALLLALVSFFRWRTQRLRLRQRELEAKVHERTLDLVALKDALEAKSAQLEQASLTDPLSGLRNRRYLHQHIDADAARARSLLAQGRTDAALVFFLIDIDRFKSVNDALGHAAGDAVIRQIPARLQQVFRTSDHLVRWGGEEFLIVVRGGSRHGAAELAERARAAIASRPFVLDDGQPLACTCSVGFACYPLDPGRPGDLSWQEVVSVADAALLQAKQEGRNRWLGVIDADASRRPAQPAGWLDGDVATVLRA